MIFTNLIQTNLHTSFIGRDIEYFSFTDSTNDDAFKLISNNEASHGMLIITDYQKKGRGRRNNTWLSTPGNNLTFSLIIKKTDKYNISLFSILSGLSIVKGIQEFTGIECRLKWPNDIILNDKKIGGILIENRNNNNYIVIGIGLNINQEEIPSELKNIASSLRIEKRTPTQREPLLAFILNKFEKLYNSESTVWISEWKRYCNHLNKDVTFNNDNEVIKGVFVDVTKDGNAIVDINSEKTVISSGILEIL